MQNTTATEDEIVGFSRPQLDVSRGHSISYQIDSGGVVIKLSYSPKNFYILGSCYFISFDLRDGQGRSNIESYFYGGAVRSSISSSGKQTRITIPTAARMNRILEDSGTSLQELLKEYIEWRFRDVRE